MTTNAKTPRMSDALCTMTYLAEWYDAVALEMTTMPKMGADEAHHEQENIRPVKKLLCVGHGFFHNGLLSAAAAF